jgi:hypothetical protein
MSCLKNDKKEYIIPTKNWLNPISKFITEDLNNDSLLILSNLMKKEKVVVKITNGDNKKLIIFNKMLKNEPNFVKTYCVFSCEEDKNALNLEYRNSMHFCNGDNNDYSKKVTLEIMKRYNSGSLEKFSNRMNMNNFTNVLKQVILAQLHIFNKYGFIHNDLHLGNILTETSSNIDYKLDYVIKKQNITLLTRFKIIISDFDRSVSYDPDIYNKYNPNFMDYNVDNIKECTYDIEFNLLENIINSIKDCCRLLTSSLYNDVINKLNDYLKNNYYYNENYYGIRKILRNYYKKRDDYNGFKNKTLSIVIIISNMIYGLITNDKNVLTLNAIGL